MSIRDLSEAGLHANWPIPSRGSTEFRPGTHLVLQPRTRQNLNMEDSERSHRTRGVLIKYRLFLKCMSF